MHCKKNVLHPLRNVSYLFNLNNDKETFKITRYILLQAVSLLAIFGVFEILT